MKHLGNFFTAEAAALCYARHIGKDAAAAAATAAAAAPLTADEVRAMAEAEGLLLARADSATGFKGVSKIGSKFKAHTREGAKLRYLGLFATAEEAALCYARHTRSDQRVSEV